MSIIISPAPSLAAGDSYYNIPQEFPNDPLRTLLRWVNYSWAFDPKPTYPFVQPPS